MKLKVVLFICAVTSLFAKSVSAIDYAGNNMLIVLGTTKHSSQFKDFKDYWELNKQNENTSRGIKVVINDVFDRVDDIIIAGEGMEVNGTKFSRCPNRMPLGILMNDDTTNLTRKLGPGLKQIGKNTMLFYQRGTLIEVNYTNPNLNKISSLKFYKGTRPANMPEKRAAEVQQPVAAVVAQPKKVEEKKPTVQLASMGSISGKNNVSNTIGAKEISAVVSPFKRAVLDVFKASKESNFWSIKKGVKQTGNFWNYKYCYDTKLKFPGEKYNMVYSFPFASSTLDFVVVIKEADEFDQSFEDAYHQYEKQLMGNFTKGDGWIGSCLPNTDKSRLSDLEIHNDDFGSVILDYSRNPKGRHILYLRFLLYSN